MGGKSSTDSAAKKSDVPSSAAEIPASPADASSGMESPASTAAVADAVGQAAAAEHVEVAAPEATVVDGAVEGSSVAASTAELVQEAANVPADSSQKDTAQPRPVEQAPLVDDTTPLKQDTLAEVMIQLKALVGRGDDLKKVFMDLDIDKSGSLGRDEIERALNGLGLSVGESEMSRVMETFDKDKDGHVLLDDLFAALSAALTQTVAKPEAVATFADVPEASAVTTVLPPLHGAKVSRLCVRNLSKDVGPTQLRALFEPHGEIVSVQVRTNKDGRSRGFGFVVMQEVDAEKAVAAVNGTELDGKAIDVQPSERQSTVPGKGEESPAAGEVAGAKSGKGKGKVKAEGKRKGEGKGSKLDFGGKGGKGKKAVSQAPMVPPAAAQMGYPQYYYDPRAAFGYPGQAWQMPYMHPGAMQHGYNPYGYNMHPAVFIAAAHAAQHQAAVAAAMQQPAQQIGEAIASGTADAVSQSRVFEGSLKSLSANKGYGFIVCAETRAIHGRDVYVDSAVLPAEAKIRDRIRFSIEMSEKGHPRAKSVELVPLESVSSSTH